MSGVGSSSAAGGGGDAADERQVLVKFTTAQAKHRVTELPFNVPMSLRRYGLSEVVNHLLSSAAPVPFEFLIQGELLRSSVEEFLLAKRISTEEALEIEYFEAFPPPVPRSGFKHDDWVSCVAGHARGPLFVTGCYDRKVYLWNGSGECVAAAAGHEDVVKDICLLAPEEDAAAAPPAYAVTASADETLRAWRLGDSSAAETCIFRGHEGTVTAVAGLPAAATAEAPQRQRLHFLSGGWDCTVRLWSVREGEQGDAEEEPVPAKRTRSGKGKEAAVRTHGPLALYTGHTQPVTTVVWPAATTAFSGGMDRCLREWDVESGVNTSSLNGPKVILRLAYSALSGLVASGNADGAVRLWDPRVRDGVVVKLALSSHKGWVSSVAWSTKSSHQLVSGGYDGTAKVWDVRSKLPLFTLSDHTDKVLCVDWAAGDYIASGGADGKLLIHGTTPDRAAA